MRYPLFPLLSLLLLVAGCGQTVTGTSAYVTIGNAWNDSDALPAASEWCGRFNKTPRYRYMEKYRATFDCVAVE